MAGITGERLEAAAQTINRRFVQSLPASEVRSVAKSATAQFVNEATGTVRPRWFKTSTVVSALSITPDEQRSLSVLIGKDEKARRLREKRRASGIRSHAEKAQETLQRVREAILRERPGVTDGELAKVLGLTRQTVAKYRKLLQ